MAIELYRTGISGLDEVLLGGFLRGRSIMIEGYTGTGKTVLGMTLLCGGILEYGESGLLVSFEQLPELIYSDARTLGWDFREMERQGKLRVVFISPATLVEEISTQVGRINQLLAEIGARRLFLDGINMLDTVEPNPFRRRTLIDRVIASFRREGLNIYFSRDKPEQSPMGTVPESYIADTVIQLTYTQQHNRRIRYLEVVKSRGQPSLNGLHTFSIGPGGVMVYPRQKMPAVQPPAISYAEERTSFDVAALDELLGGGLFKRSSTLIAGSSGTGKTLLCMQFLIAGARRGERGLFISLEEPPEQIAIEARILAPDIAELLQSGTLQLLRLLPLEMDVNEQIIRIRDIISQGNISRLAFDSLANYEDVLSEVDYRDYVIALLTFIKSQGITALVTTEIRGLTSVDRLTTFGTSYVLDNLILLRFVELANSLRRAIVVLKTRGSQHANEIREFVIGPHGIEILPIEASVPVLAMQQYSHLLTSFPSVHGPSGGTTNAEQPDQSEGS